jgi:beta-lactamase class A
VTKTHTAVLRAAALAAAATTAFVAAFATAVIVGSGSAGPAVSPPPETPTPTPTQAVSATPTPRPATPTPSPTPTMTPTPTPPPGWEEFGGRLQAAVDGYWATGRFAVAVTDLQTGKTVAVNGDQHMLTGCVVNLFVLISAMREVEAGLLDASAVDWLIEATIWSSNATTAYELYRITGGGDVAAGVAKVQAILDELGMGNSRIDHPPAYSGDGELALVRTTQGAVALAVPDEENNWTTANDLAKALQALYHGELLSPAGTLDLLERLTQVKPGLNYLVAYIPGEGTVSHKNGFFPDSDGTWVDNDVGIVRVEREGRSYAYAVAFFSDSVVGKYNDIALGQEISRLAYEYFASTYGEGE